MRSRSRSWVVVLILGLGLAALYGRVSPSGELQAQDVPTFTPVFTATTVPTATPPLTPPPTSAAPGCATTFPIEIGDGVTVRGGVNVRTGPSINGPLIGALIENRFFIVVDGPVCAENFIWWGIAGGGIRGWVAERNLELDFIVNIQGREELDCPPVLNLVIGERVTLVTNVRIRAMPSTEGQVLTVALEGTQATVLENAPLCADGYIWRRVRVTSANVVYDGWMVEGSRADFTEFYIEFSRPEPCLVPQPFSIGDRARVAYRDTQPKNLRLEPNRTATVLYTLVRGIPLEIIGGPVCNQGMNWWNVRVLGSTPVEGWLAEGGIGNIFIRPFEDPDLVN